MEKGSRMWFLKKEDQSWISKDSSWSTQLLNRHREPHPSARKSLYVIHWTYTSGHPLLLPETLSIHACPRLLRWLQYKPKGSTFYFSLSMFRFPCLEGVSMCTWVQMPVGQQPQISWSWSSEHPNMGAGNKIPVFFKSSEHSEPLTHQTLSSSERYFL